MKVSEALLAHPRSWVITECILFVLGIGYLDYITDWRLSFFMFYAVAIFIIAWLGDRRATIAFAALCVVISFVANYNSVPFRTLSGYLWSTLNRTASFAFVAIGGAAMRRQRELIRAKLEAMTRARHLEQEIVRVSEREQMRIGQDLHDGLCQNLAAIDCAAACLRSDLQKKAQPEAEAAGVIQAMLKEAVIEARSLARGIFPVQMDAEGLPTALEELVSTTNRLRQIAARIEVSGDIELADPHVGMHLYRIAQEALSNAVRHANASQVTVSLARAGKDLTMTIADDGCGFVQNGSAARGMGLSTLRYRAQVIGANLETISQPAQGTTVRCSLTLAQ